MSRKIVEFQCTNCSYWNYPKMNTELDGNYEVVCGNCDHVHYRVVKGGYISEDRHHSTARVCERIHVMKSACEQKKRKLGIIGKIRQLEAVGLSK